MAGWRGGGRATAQAATGNRDARGAVREIAAGAEEGRTLGGSLLHPAGSCLAPTAALVGRPRLGYPCRPGTVARCGRTRVRRRPDAPEVEPAGAAARRWPVPDGILLRLDGFEGPLGLLLELAREQQVDLARLSVRDLADQVLAAVTALGRDRWLRLEQAADWLVMAAWLTWLKSRLPLPPQDSAEAHETGRALMDRLAEQRQVRALAAWLGARPRLGHDVWTRGARSEFAAGGGDGSDDEVPALLQACLLGLVSASARPPCALAEAVRRRPAPPLWTPLQALARLRALLEDDGSMPGGGPLPAFLPRLREDLPRPALRRRAALASTFAAALELAHEAKVSLRQESAFGDITVVRGQDTKVR